MQEVCRQGADMLGSSRGCTPEQIDVEAICLIGANTYGKQQHRVIVDLPHDGGEEDPIDLHRKDEGEVEEQGGCVPQKHLDRFGH